MENISKNNLVPTEFYLGQNYPNPFKEKTTIKFCIAYKTKVKLEVFNAEVEMIKTLMDEEKEAGTYEIEFDASIFHSNNWGNLSDRIFLYRLSAGNYFDEKEMIIQNKF